MTDERARGLRYRWDFWLLVAALAAANLPLLWGGDTGFLAFHPGLAREGRWWLALTGQLTHITWYHFLIDTIPFLLVYATLDEARPSVRLFYFFATGAGSLAAGLLLSPHLLEQGLRGLSGITYGTAAVSCLEMAAGEGSDRTRRVIGAGFLGLLAGLVAWEMATGRFPLEFLLFGMVGEPVFACHAGGVAGGSAAFLVLLAVRSGHRKRAGEKRAGRFERGLPALFFLAWAMTGAFSPGPANPAPGAPETQAPSLRPGTPRPVAGREVVYEVVPGDYLYGIARRHGVGFPAIARANRIGNPNRIFAGRKIIIPLETILPAEPAASEGREIIVNIPEQRLYLFIDGKLARIYPAAVGLVTWQTPVGDFTVANRVRDPAWHVPPGISRERELPPGTVVPPGPENPLGGWWIGTSIRHTGLHGTNIPMSVGQAVSRGCVRLYPEDIAELFSLVRPGDRGRFIYEPVKATVSGGVLLVEAHPDIYGFFEDLEPFAADRVAEALEALSGRPGEVPGIDREALGKILVEARGFPVPLTLPDIVPGPRD